MPRPYRKHSRVGADDGNEDFWTFAPPPPRRPRKILMDDVDTSGRNSSALTSGGGGGDQSVLLPLASSSHAGALCSSSCTRYVMVYVCLAAIACSSMLLAGCTLYHISDDADVHVILGDTCDAASRMLSKVITLASESTRAPPALPSPPSSACPPPHSPPPATSAWSELKTLISNELQPFSDTGITRKMLRNSFQAKRPPKAVLKNDFVWVRILNQSRIFVKHSETSKDPLVPHYRHNGFLQGLRRIVKSLPDVEFVAAMNDEPPCDMEVSMHAPIMTWSKRHSPPCNNIRLPCWSIMQDEYTPLAKDSTILRHNTSWEPGHSPKNRTAWQLTSL